MKRPATTERRPSSLARLLLASLALGGCISVPDDIRADFAAPDGQRPNNYGRTLEEPEGKLVEPDRPTFVRPRSATAP